MKTLDCGCEVSPDGTVLLSMCSMHASHYAMRAGTELLERNKPKPGCNKGLRDKLLVAIAPAVVSKCVGDPRAKHTAAELTVDVVDEILKRL